ncbi:tRNA (N6-adenosine(37)-N6)-threonylcarbamoyltransferase complex ATPase TsaE [Streptococcus bovimastitidis]|uniref:tRNA threonylcarbamoyladenosine biosynthesis protein TsaE n=1 Tax=Streptococcus bovimastitidis TaxID=1856638 RepID=A0A1L8MLA1_9STRE|nr:tRNA (adenosine(37)-N6)-threonylcarbamoyltransferase complex ATPase subunit type 1 TsaE [Streptococcus bovimastitidis]OJF71560.1 tRNA (N6-adenosine(37)-N6)-threonylcarbamoyltransferase complex ATPase TsaE [Streptococcus bovimastitidis]
MFYSENENELIDFGVKIGKALKEEDVIVLSGELGAGKTTITKGIAKGLEIDQMIKSPTYTIVREYQGRLPLYHLDVYRIGDDPDSIDLDDFIYGNGVTVIEWGNLLDLDAFEDYLTISLAKKELGRQVTLNAKGPRSQELLEDILYA